MGNRNGTLWRRGHGVGDYGFIFLFGSSCTWGFGVRCNLHLGVRCNWHFGVRCNWHLGVGYWRQPLSLGRDRVNWQLGIIRWAGGDSLDGGGSSISEIEPRRARATRTASFSSEVICEFNV